jgi:hypothetical protein
VPDIGPTFHKMTGRLLARSRNRGGTNEAGNKETYFDAKTSQRRDGKADRHVER